MKGKLYDFCGKIIDEDELKLFKSIDEKCVGVTYFKKILLFKKYRQNTAVKLHWIGSLYKDEIARDIFLNEEELNLMSDGEKVLDEIRVLESLIKKRKYDIFSDYKGLKKIFYGSFSLISLKSNLRLLISELEYMKDSISRLEKEYSCKKRNEKSHYRSKNGFVRVSLLSKEDKEIIKKFGIDLSSCSEISFVDIKKRYRKMVHNIHPDKVNCSDEYIKELNVSYEKAKKIFAVY